MTLIRRSATVRALAAVTVAVCIVMLWTAMVAPSVARATSLYVSVLGSNTAGDGSVSRPFATVGHGLSVAQNGDDVYVAPGEYVGSVCLDKDVSLYGAGAGSTTIRASDTYTAVRVWGPGAGVTLAGFTITGGDFSWGGGISCNETAIIIRDNTITGNTVVCGGGGINCYECSPTIIGNTITGNTSATSGYWGGGGIFCTRGSPTITDNVITNNTGYLGGGVYCSSAWDSTDSPKIERNYIANNVGTEGGGILCDIGCLPEITNNVIVGNTATWGGGIDFGGTTTPTITNNTIVGNSAPYGGGICGGGQDLYRAAITNCVVWDNGDDLYLCSATYSDIKNPAAAQGVGNISAPPGFVATATSDFHLAAGSPCIDAATTTATVFNDLEGVYRPQGTSYDMGAYEYFVPGQQIHVDRTAPVTALHTTPASAVAAWSTSAVSVSLVATDAKGGSGVAATHYVLDSGSAQEYTGSFVIPSEGVHTLAYSSMDVSGNAESTHTATIRIDLTPPTVTGGPLTSPNAAGWFRSPVSVHFSASDALSGVAEASPDSTLASDGASQTVYGNARDVAGNWTTAMVSGVNIDLTAPRTTDDHIAAYSLNASIHLAPTDLLSGVASTTWWLDGTPGAGTNVATSVLGPHTLLYRSTDVAGNVEEFRTAQFVVGPLDAIAPTTSISGIGSGWSNHDVTFALGVTDPDSLGLPATFFGLNALALEIYSGPVTIASEGTTTISYRSIDASGNAEATRTASARIDKSGPTIAFTAAAPGSGYADITASASDSLSGLQRLETRLDDETWSAAREVVTNAPGSHVVHARAVDAVGNERDASYSFTIAFPPTTTSTRLSAPSSVKVRKALKLSGTVAPSDAAGNVVIAKTRLVRGHWRSAGSATVALNGGKFAYSFKPTVKGSWRFAATYAGGSAGSKVFKPSKSAVKSVKVK